jgi:nucleotide-binding universal stress UspA family protein
MEVPMSESQPILLATDGSPGSFGAVRVALALAEHRKQPLVALSVADPMILPGDGLSYPMIMAQPDLERNQLDHLRAAVEAQLSDAAAGDAEPRVEVAFGAVAATIVRAAVDHDATMIVLGLGRREARERWLGTETALKVTHLSHVPVLAVHPDAETLPRRVLVAIDFSDFSRDAARTALQCVPLGGELHLAHVSWTLPSGSADGTRETAWTETYRVGARVRLDEMRRELTTCEGMRCVSTVLEGETARALIKYARMSGAEMIATGSHGYGFLGRMMMGSVSTRLIRQAPCSVLVAPPRAISVETLKEGGRARPAAAPMEVG